MYIYSILHLKLLMLCVLLLLLWWRWCYVLCGQIAFTGSTEVGRRIGAEAAKSLKPCTLELGGKSPVIVCPGKRQIHGLPVCDRGRWGMGNGEG